jgi:hypothetical protein
MPRVTSGMPNCRNCCCNARVTYNTIADKVIAQLVPNVRGMLHFLHMPDVEDVDLPGLIIRLGQIIKWKRGQLAKRSLKL